MCDHANNWYRAEPNGPGLCFDCWRADNNARRQAVRTELAELLRFGVYIRETWPSGVSIDWHMTPDGHTVTEHRSDRGGIVRSSSRPFEYPSTAWTAAALAEHLEARAYGFGFELKPYCIGCGENLAELKTATDKTADADPICHECAERRATRALEAWEESHGREV